MCIFCYFCVLGNEDFLWFLLPWNHHFFCHHEWWRDDLGVVRLRHSEIVWVSTQTQNNFFIVQSIIICPRELCLQEDRWSKWCSQGDEATWPSRAVFKYSRIRVLKSSLVHFLDTLLALLTNRNGLSWEHEPSSLPSSYIRHRTCITNLFDTVFFLPNSQESCCEFTGRRKEEYLNQWLDETFLPSLYPSY